jgi:hypothetical protein
MEIKLTCPKGFPTRGVLARFADPGAIVVGYRVTSLSPASPLRRVEVCSHGADIRWATPLDRVEVVLSIELESGAPVVTKAFWRDASGTPQGEARSEEDAILLQSRSMWELATRDRFLAATRIALLSAIPVGDDPRRLAARRYFCDLDFNTNRLLMDLTGMGTRVVQRRDPILTQVGAVLLERVLSRLDAAVRSEGSVPEDLPQASEALVKEVSALQLAIVERHFGPPAKLDRELAWRAFLWFANGELKLPGQLWKDWDGGPAGGFIFFFAEFALLAIDMKVDAERWSELLAPMVAMQRVYARAYRPAGEAATWQFSDYDPGTWSAEQQVPADEIEALVAEYDALAPEDLRVRVGQHARETFPGSCRVEVVPVT